MTDILAPLQQREERPEDVRRRYCLASPRSIVAVWRARIHARWALKQMAKASPHLVDDIGLTKQQVEAEIAKPFWRV